MASVDQDGKVTALSEGTSVITVKTTVDGNDYTDTCEVTVKDRYDMILAVEQVGTYFAGNAYDMTVTVKKNNVDLQGAECIVSVEPSNAATYNKDTGKLTLSDSASGNITVSAVYGDNLIARSQTIESYIEIKDKASFDKVYTVRDGQFKVTADIDYGNAKFTPPSSQFAGTIDGQGHVIYNGELGFISGSTTNSCIIGEANGATVKNLAFVGIRGTQRAGGIFSFGDNYTIDNCFMEMVYDGNQSGTVAQGNNPAGILTGKVRGGAKVTNSVTVVTLEKLPATSVGMVAAKTEATGVVKNCYSYVNMSGQAVISTEDAATANTHNSEDSYVYTSAASFADMIKDGFDTDVWDFPEDGVQLFKNAKVRELLVGAPACSDSSLEIPAGSQRTLNFTGDKKYEVSLSQAIDGVTFANGVLSVAETVEAGTAFNVIASSVFDKNTKTEVAVTVLEKPASVITVTSEKTLNLKMVTGYSVVTSQIAASASGGETLSYGSSNTGVASVSGSGVITPVSDGTATITVSSAGLEPVEIAVTVDVFTPITTIAEFNAIQTSQNDAQVLTGKYMLMNDIDASVDTTTWVSLGNCKRNSIWNGTQGFNGIFDGNGHTVSNLTPVAMKGSVVNNVAPFGTLMSGGVIRNIAFVNLTLNMDIGGGIANMNYGTIENCYTTVKFTNKFNAGNGNPSGGIVAKNNGLVKNCITAVSTEITANTEQYGGIVGGMFAPDNLVKDSFVIGRTEVQCTSRATNSTFEAYNKFENAKGFDTKDAFFADGGADTSSFSDAIWNIDGTAKTIALKPNCSFNGTKL